MARAHSKYGAYWKNPNTPRKVGCAGGRRRILSDDDVRLLYFMRDTGMRYREIMEYFNITAPTVKHWLDKRGEPHA